MRSILVVVLAGCSADAAITKDQLGRLIFHDTELSEPPGQSCADCHAPQTAFSDPEDDRTSAGAVRGRVGARNAPTAMYTRYIPPLHVDPTHGYVGGLFWDGRADTLEAQAAGPLLNPLEMNNPDKASVVDRVRRARYARGFRDVFGGAALDDVDTAFAHVTEALAAYERTVVFAPFSSKYDRFLAGGLLTEQEQRGLAIFEDPARGNCASCHPSRPSADGSPPLFTTFSYANLGLPKFGNSMFYVQPPELNPDGMRFIDHGLMTTVHDPAHDGKFRIPTLRNVARTAPYGHNGYFRTLPELVDFLVTRDTGSTQAVGTCTRTGAAPRIACAWPAPEVAATIDPRVGHASLGSQDVADLVAFLATLTDE